MQPADPSLAKALRDGERSADQRIRLGGRELGPQVGSWSLDQSYATDLPDAMRAFSGSSSAQLELTLGGRGGVSAPALYGPWAPRATGDVIRPRQSVTMDWGLAGSTLPQFRGTVRSRSAQSGGDTVSLTALDGAERLRMPARLPRPSGGIDGDAPYGPSVANNWTASPTWCVDHLLRNAGIHTCPPPRPTSILYASLHGGAAANIGYLTALSGDWTKWTKTNAPWEAAVQGPASGLASAEYIPSVRPVNRLGDGLWAEAWFDNTGSATGTRQLDLTLSWTPANLTPHYTTVRVDFAKGELQAFSGKDKVPTGNGSIIWTVPALTTQSGRWHIGFWLKFSSAGVPTFEARVRYPDGNGIHCTPGTVAGAVAASHLGNVILRLGNLRVEGLQVSSLTTVPSTPADILQEGRWTKTAALDPPDTGLRVIPAVSGTAWEAITAIARATLSTAEFDGNGIFRWRNRSRWANAPATSQLTVTSARELASLTVTEEIDACRNYCSVTWDNWENVSVNKIAKSKISTAKLSIPAGTTGTIVFGRGDDEYDCWPPETYIDALPGCISFRNADSDTAANVHGAVEVGTVISDGIVTVTMRNRSSSTVWLRGGARSMDMLAPTVSGDGGPGKHWYSAWNTISQGHYGVQLYEHDPEGWVQDDRAAREIAEALRAAGVYPVPLLQDVEILADPRIQLGDVVRVKDTTGAVLDSLAWVVGIKTEAEGQAVKQTLTLRGAAYNGVPTDTGLTPDPPVSGSVA